VSNVDNMSNMFDTVETIDNYDRTVSALLTWIQPVELRNVVVKVHDLQVEFAKYMGKSLDKTISSFVPTK
jgi:hypothetical protein